MYMPVAELSLQEASSLMARESDLVLRECSFQAQIEYAAAINPSARLLGKAFQYISLLDSRLVIYTLIKKY